MTIKRILLCGAAVAGIFAGTAQAQTSVPESILPPRPEKVEQPIPGSNRDAPTTAAPKREQNVDEAFGDMRVQSGEIVQEIPSLEG